MVVDSWVSILIAEGIMMVTAVVVDKEDTVEEIMALEGLMGEKEMVAAAGGGGGVNGGSGHRLMAEGGTVAAECLVVVHGFLESEVWLEWRRRWQWREVRQRRSAQWQWTLWF